MAKFFKFIANKFFAPGFCEDRFTATMNKSKTIAKFNFYETEKNEE